MRIAIHQSPISFSKRWIDYCQRANIPYKIVDCYQSDIISQLKDCDALMWHFFQANQKDVLFAKQLLYSLEASGKCVFPGFHTAWHFDDKIGQKYLLESMDIPLVPSYVFYDKQSATKWCGQTQFPKVFKLRGGAGSANVRLAKSYNDAIRLVNKAFGKGFSKYNAWGNLKDRIRKYRMGKANLVDVAKGVVRLFISTSYARTQGKECGYVYFQDFVPNNDSDVRVIVVGQKAFAIKRLVRENDFRASGSGVILYDRRLFHEDTIRKSFEIAEKLRTQSLALDYVFDEKNRPLLVEISYGFGIEAYDFCEGYWDKELNWVEGRFNPQEWMVDLIIQEIEERKNEPVSQKNGFQKGSIN
jgi:glutathione synthase/RimK-type ligase-like ATP-grasp enzyme